MHISDKYLGPPTYIAAYAALIPLWRIAVAVGPVGAMLAITIAVVIQALHFGDGGLTAIGAHCPQRSRSAWVLHPAGREAAR